MTDATNVTVTVCENGPYEVVGEVDLLDANGELIRQTTKTFLCRCGHSAKKPYCDGSHKKFDFQDAGLAPQ
ncbi:MAG: CDGSH iron-sulfur domain-containing protein [Candidatus Nanopelagicales bacterium]|nr:CDGSH iron-sulfur domain-containing protein [Candidatus Nanopelagicales bacterium]